MKFVLALIALFVGAQAFAATYKIPGVNIVSVASCEGGEMYAQPKWEDSITIRVNGFGFCYTIGQATEIVVDEARGTILFNGKSYFTETVEDRRYPILPYVTYTTTKKVTSSIDMQFAQLTDANPESAYVKNFIQRLRRGDYKHIIFTGSCFSSGVDCGIYDSFWSVKLVSKKK